MLVTIPFLALVGLSAMIALTDWRRAWMLALICGVLQDPVRKMTPGQPVWLMFAVVIIFGVILFSTLSQLQVAGKEFSYRFPSLSNATLLLVLFLVVAALNGLVTFGFDSWKGPVMSLALYLAPIPAVLMAYLFADRETRIEQFLVLYSVITAAALSGTLFEYLRMDLPGLGLVSWRGGDYIRHLPGIQIRMVSGFYRSPDTMGIHAASLASIGIGMAARRGFSLRGWPWLLAIGWGFSCAMISGRRKALYFIAVFAIVFTWRFLRRMQMSQAIALLAAAGIVGIVIGELRGSDDTRVYTSGALTSRGEIASRFEGGAIGTLRQVGFMGGGLGIATQGAQHFMAAGAQQGWQEGGIAKVAAEVGVPGLLSGLVILVLIASISLRLTAIGDVDGSTQFMRVLLFALVCAHGASFVASAQAYSDPLLMLLAAFFLGCFLATATLDERLASDSSAVSPKPRRPLVAT